METDCLQSYGTDALDAAKRIQSRAHDLYDGTDRACQEYGRLCMELEERMKAAFNHVAFSLRTVKSPASRIECWGKFMELCDTALEYVSMLREKTPECGQPEDFDFLLDLRNDAAERSEFFESLQAG